MAEAPETAEAEAAEEAEAKTRDEREVAEAAGLWESRFRCTPKPLVTPLIAA